MATINRAILVSIAFSFAAATAPANAAFITATLPGADFSLPATIGTFTFYLPEGSVVNGVRLYSPNFSFEPGNAFALEAAFDGVPILSLPLSQTDTEFFMGSGVTYPDPLLEIIKPLLNDGAVELSLSCSVLPSFPGPCPSDFTFFVPSTGGLNEWRLVISTTSVPEPATIALLALGLAALAALRRREQ